MEIKVIKNGIVAYEKNLNRVKKQFCDYKIGNVTLMISSEEIGDKITIDESWFNFNNVSKLTYNLEVEKTSIYNNISLKSIAGKNYKSYICNINMSINVRIEYLDGDKISILGFTETFSDFFEVNKKSVGINVTPLILVVYIDNFNKMLMNLQYTLKLE